jgi:3-phosphoshikimate 1-carboxyvinyltransferase
MLINYQELELNEVAINLPASKSISNRALIIEQLCTTSIKLENLSTATDTQILQALLQNKSFEKEVGMAGTVARFLSAYLATQNSTYIINGDERMQERPMKILLDALHFLGAEINYLGNQGFLPIEINGSKIRGGKLNLDASISSQFVSALMMIGPVLKGGLQLQLKGISSSKPYLLMTQKIMEHFGVKIKIENDKIEIPEQNYQAARLAIESDWSSASYFYSALALVDEGSLLLRKTALDSWQGDSILGDIYYRLGIITSRNGDDVLLEKSENIISFLDYDFSDCPDLAQTVICTCVGLGLEGLFTGLHTLRNKETDRIQALQNELIKFNWQLKEEEPGFFNLSRSQVFHKGSALIRTYNDHRMAMAFAPLVIVYDQLEFDHPEVVQKSFPHFWEEMQKIGIH